MLALFRRWPSFNVKNEFLSAISHCRMTYKFTLQLQSSLIGIFTHLYVCLPDAIHDLKWMNNIQIWQNVGKLFSNFA